MRKALRKPIACLLIAGGLCSCNIRLPVEGQALASRSVRQLVSSSASPAEPHKTVPVWLIADKFHTGMVFPYRWLLESGFVPPTGFPPCRYVVMSWGNTDAYSEDGIGGPVNWLEVLFTPTESVMELIPVNWKVIEVMHHQRIWIKRASSERGPHLANFLNQCSKVNADGTPVVVRPSSWGRGVQLESSFSYFIPRVCNVWSVQVIESLGGKINPWFALTADGLIRQIEKSPNDFKMIAKGKH